MRPNPLDEYRLDLPKLKLGSHQFTYHLNHSFLSCFALNADSGVTQLDAKGEIVLQRTAQHIDVRFAIHGTITSVCDRCLQQSPFPIDIVERVVYSHSEAMAEADDAELQYLAANSRWLDLAPDLFDFVMLSLPYRRVPAACADTPLDADVCPLGHALSAQGVRILREGEQYLDASELFEDQSDDSPADPDAGSIDPRWTALRGLKPDGSSEN